MVYISISVTSFLQMCLLILCYNVDSSPVTHWVSQNDTSISELLMVTPRDGHFQNCGNTTWYTYWNPETLLMGKSVAVKGSYTFPREFKAGKVTIHAGLYSPVPINVTCQQLTANNKCTEGRTIEFDHDYTVPVLPSKLENILVKIVAVDQDGYQLLCGRAIVSVH